MLKHVQTFTYYPNLKNLEAVNELSTWLLHRLGTWLLFNFSSDEEKEFDKYLTTSDSLPSVQPGVLIVSISFFTVTITLHNIVTQTFLVCACFRLHD